MALNHEIDIIRGYLLGQLSEEQSQAIEQRMLSEDDFFGELEITEAQLVDDYVGGCLTSDERDQFEKHFLATPERQQNLQFARLLRRYVASHPIHKPAAQSWWQQWENQSWGLRVAAGVTAVAIIAVALWFAVPRASSPDTLATVTLTIGSGNRAEGGVSQTMPLPSGNLKIVLRLPDNVAPETVHQVRLIAGEGTTRIFDITERDAKTVSLVIPSSQLKRGSYALKLLVLSADGTVQPVNGSYLLTLE